MPLTDGELWRAKHELGFNMMEVGAEPYFEVVAIFEQVIQTYLNEEATTTSSTTVAKAEDEDDPEPVALTVVSATDMVVHATIVVDVDHRREVATIQSVSGSVITAMLTKAHSGTYPVSLDGGITIVREILRGLRKIAVTLGEDGVDTLGIERVDEIKFKGGDHSTWIGLKNEQMRLRDELSSAFGLPNYWRSRGGSGQRMEAY